MPNESLPLSTPEFTGQIERLITDSTPRRLVSTKAPKDAPNVLLILLDDVGFGSFAGVGGPVPTPGLDKIIEQGLLYNQFHTTAPELQC